MSGSSAPVLIVLAGPNGAGKSTFFTEFLESLGLPFVNAAAIEKEHFGTGTRDSAIAAACLADDLRRQLVAEGGSFIMETVLSDSGGHKIRFFKEAQEASFDVHVHYIGLASWKQSRLRVAQRVIEGGHDVPNDRIEARYPRALANLAELCDLVDHLRIYDNSPGGAPFRLVATFENGVLTALCESIPAWIASLDLEKRITRDTQRFPL